MKEHIFNNICPNIFKQNPPQQFLIALLLCLQTLLLLFTVTSYKHKLIHPCYVFLKVFVCKRETGDTTDVYFLLHMEIRAQTPQQGGVLLK